MFSLQSYAGSVESPRASRVFTTCKPAGQRAHLNHLSDEFSVKSDESSACNSESEPRKPRSPASEKSAKTDSDGKVSKRKSTSDYFERKSLYKPLQKIYSFKSKFTDRKSGGKAQEKLSEKLAAKAAINTEAKFVKPAAVGKKSALAKSSSSSEMAVKEGQK